MKKQKHQIIFIIICAAYFLLNGAIPREAKSEQQKQSEQLQAEGWSKKAADHIAKVELKIIKADSEYYGYKED